MKLLKKYIFTTKVKWWQFYHPWSGFSGGLLMLAVLLIAYGMADAIADTEFDATVNGYSGYDYDTGEYIDVSADPTGGYDVYNYETHEYSDIEPSSSGGFTVYSSDDGYERN